jgi:hypothetical protein
VLLGGNGDGPFQPRQTLTLPVGGYVYAMAVADLTGDGKPDIITASSDGTVSGGTVRVLLGNGDGTFQPQQSFPGRLRSRRGGRGGPDWRWQA